jgi:hypothetical protein
MTDLENFERRKKHYRGYKKGWERVYKKKKLQKMLGKK